MKGSLLIVAFFVLGVVLGVTRMLSLGEIAGDLSFCALAGLLFCVGMGVGSDFKAFRSLKKLNLRLLFLPALTIIGTLAGAAFSSVFFHGRSVADCMAVGSGMAYYSLSSVFITQYKGAELGAVALLANIARELITLMCAPLLVKLWGNLAPISAGGATTMDTTLPVISRYSGRNFVVLSIYHGFLCDFSVPFLVTLFCTI